MMTTSHSNDEVPDKESKTTSEKPVSLSPLNLKEALKGLLKVGKPEQEEDKNGKNHTDNGSPAL